MKTTFSKEDFKKYSQKVSQCWEKTVYNMGGDIDENTRNTMKKYINIVMSFMNS